MPSNSFFARLMRHKNLGLLLTCGVLLGLAACSEFASEAPQITADTNAETPSETVLDAAASVLTSDAPNATVVTEHATLVLTGGNVVTVDPELGNQQAIALKDHRIVAVGSNEEISAHTGPATQVVNLNGRTVIPGFIEGHGHYLSLGRARQILDLSTAKNWGDVVGQVAVAVDKAQPGEWIFGRGWHQDKWQSEEGGIAESDEVIDGVPANDSLNVVSRNNPVYLGHASGHAAYANDAALAAAGIDKDTPDPAGGTIVHKANGMPSGLLRENAQDAVENAIVIYDERLTEEEKLATLREQSDLAAREALKHGVTSFHDAGASFDTIDFFKTLEAENALPVRLYVMVRGESNAEMEKRLPDYRMVAEDNDFLTVRSIKRQIDGALGAHGAWLLEPYVDLPSTPGLVLEPVTEIERTAELALQYGYQVNTHAIGTRANRETLDIYERIWNAGVPASNQATDKSSSTTATPVTATPVNGRDLRWRIEHAQHIHPDDVPRFGALGVIAAMQGVHCTSDGPWIASRLGAERTEITSYPWRTLIETGAIIGNGTDVPVEPISAIASFYSTVTRITNKGEAFYPQHVMTREEALASYTINNAFAAFEEDDKGSLTPGKLADLVVLSQDIMTVPEDQIPSTQVDYTLVGGEIKYARAGAN